MSHVGLKGSHLPQSAHKGTSCHVAARLRMDVVADIHHVGIAPGASRPEMRNKGLAATLVSNNTGGGRHLGILGREGHQSRESVFAVILSIVRHGNQERTISLNRGDSAETDGAIAEEPEGALRRIAGIIAAKRHERFCRGMLYLLYSKRQGNGLPSCYAVVARLHGVVVGIADSGSREGARSIEIAASATGVTQHNLVGPVVNHSIDNRRRCIARPCDVNQQVGILNHTHDGIRQSKIRVPHNSRQAAATRKDGLSHVLRLHSLWQFYRHQFRT